MLSKYDDNMAFDVEDIRSVSKKMSKKNKKKKR